jgi:hypothetical protein
MKAELEACRGVGNKVHGALSLGIRQEPSRMTARGVALPGGSEKKLYSEALGNERKLTRLKITVTSKENQTSEMIRELLKSKVNPTEIKVGINNLKSLRNGKVLIETNTKEKLEMLGKDINEKCGDKLEAHIHKLRNPRLVIINVPEDITTDNLEDTLLAQNPDLDLVKGDIEEKFSHETKKHIRNLMIEVGTQTIKTLPQKKVRLGWLICKLDDYVVVNRRFKCSRFNHRFRDCRGEETCPL